jgi:hypothetical protein
MPEKPRTMVAFSNWKIDDAVATGSFASSAPNDAIRIDFARPEAQ